ncbi:MAG: csoR 1 [Anaerosporomusa subterranea]|jgi:DNA-binding FrmR family transcriptional regulator|nr:metal-sensitive transcriptional regulator [Anaerosporomusa subterranea]MDF2501152.1 csoR 1 [Anaerosporomusa subterranea]
MMTKEQLKKSVLQRLGTIKGHVAGIEKMVEENKNCEDILFQLSAITGAVNKLSAHILEQYAEACLEDVHIDDTNARQRIENLTKTMITMLKK